MRLVASVTPALGVRVAVKTSGLPVAVIVPSVPFATDTSALVKPAGASLKVKVTTALSPIPREVSSTAIETVGATVSMA